MTGVAPVDVDDYIAARFMERVLIREGCWLWGGAIGSSRKGGGYAQFSVRFVDGTIRTYRMARWAYERFVGPIPEGLQVDHLCRTRECVRPDHLEPVTSFENMRRAFAARRGHHPLLELADAS